MGLPTGSRTYRLDDPAKYKVSSLYYDHRGRVVQSHASNYVGGFEDGYFTYSFTGKVKQRRHVHTKNADTITETYTYDYGSPISNPAERLLSVKHRLDEGVEVTLAEYG